MPYSDFVRWGNGGDKPGAGYRRSLIPGWWHVQQFAAACGTVQGTARDRINGRNGQAPLGKKFGNAWFIPIDVAMEYIDTVRLTDGQLDVLLESLGEGEDDS